MPRRETRAGSSPESSAPERSLVQRRDALRRANEIRTKRAGLKRELGAGNVQIAALLQSPPDYLETAMVIDLLIAAPGYGHVKAAKILTRCGIRPNKAVGGLTDRQRQALIRLIQPHS